MKVLGIILCIPLAIVLIIACTAENSTDTPTNGTTPDPKPCDEVEGNCFWLRFNGLSCPHAQPTVFKTGPFTLLFFNKSEAEAAVNLLRHTGDETTQDMIDYIGEEPSTRHHPTWTDQLGTWTETAPGENYIWEGVLEPGIHTIACARLDPFGVWYGGAFTVEE